MAILIHARSERQSERTLSEQTAAIFSSESLLACISSRSRLGDFDSAVGEGSAICPTISPALQPDKLCSKALSRLQTQALAVVRTGILRPPCHLFTSFSRGAILLAAAMHLP